TNVTTTIANDGSWSATVPQSAVATNGTYPIAVQVADKFGNVFAANETLTLQVTHGILLPTVTVNTIGGDNVLDASGAQNDLTISGTTFAVEQGQIVKVKLINATGAVAGTFTGSVGADRTWSVIVPKADLGSAALPDGTYTVQASVSDHLGYPVQAGI